ncbi:MAG TPA: metallophosphoesterase [Bacteroidales bacterium]|nr:metallophosphoesterase [Bacteroidales bacterium]
MKSLIAYFTVMIISFLVNGTDSRNSSGPDQDQTPLFSFGVIADVQYCDCEPSGTRFYKSSLEKLGVAFGTFEEEKVEFVVNLGDLIDREFDSFNTLTDVLKGNSIKLYNVAGNHDFSVDERQKKHVLPLLTGKTGYYSFSHGSFRFIILDGNEVSTYGPGSRQQVKEAVTMIEKLREEGEPNGMDWNGGIGSKQIEWLKDQLNNSIRENQKVFILCHFPVWPVNEHNLLNYRQIIEIMQPYDNIIAWFSGHNHAGNYGNLNMVHFYNFKGMVETPDQNSFAIVDVYPNKIWIRGSGRERSMILAY